MVFTTEDSLKLKVGGGATPVHDTAMPVMSALIERGAGAICLGPRRPVVVGDMLVTVHKESLMPPQSYSRRDSGGISISTLTVGTSRKSRWYRNGCHMQQWFKNDGTPYFVAGAQIIERNMCADAVAAPV